MTDVNVLEDKAFAIFWVIISILGCRINNSTTSISWILILTKVYLILVFSWATLIFTYCFDISNKSSFINKSLSYITSFTIRVKDIYFVLVNDNANIACL